jgi:hypothetical protein
LSGLRGGLFRDGRGNPSVIINGEWPIPGVPSADKESMERLHLDRFCTDTLIGTGLLPYGDISPGSDPPDFVGKSSGQEVGIECTQLTSPVRREVKALFERVRAAIEDTNRDRFRHLRGVNIYMWFDVEGQISKPPRRTDPEFVAEILEGLDAYRFDPAKAGLPSLELPNQAPDLNIHTTPSGCRFYGIAMANAVPATPFFVRLGFEIGLAYTTVHTRDDAIDELARLIDGHDHPRTLDLLITVGGPDIAGYVYPSEDALAIFALEEWFLAKRPDHLRIVYLHRWSTGSIVELFPTLRVLVPDLYPGGIRPAFHSAQ